MTTLFEERTRDCRRALAAADASGAVLFPGPNLYYLSGFHEEPGERHLHLVVGTEGDPVFVAPEMYEEQIADASWVADVRTWGDGDDPRALIDDVLDELGLDGGRVLLDDRMWARFTQDLRALLPDAEFGLASEVFDDLRIRKDSAELETLRRAGALADEVSEEIRALGDEVVGMTETELAREIDRRLGDRGDGPAFGTIASAGPNGAKPHHRHGDRRIERGDPVVLDFGPWVDHYPGDQTRTVVFAGEPPEGFERAYEAVFVAQEAAVRAVRPGVEAQEIDREARTVIENYGFGDEFIHRTGHGVGLEVHEAPYIVEGNDRVLEPGMVFSVEPGVYREGEFGIRIEDLVAVTDDGFERLNGSSWDWRPS